MRRGDGRHGAPFSNKLVNQESDDGWFVVSRKAHSKPLTSTVHDSKTTKDIPSSSNATDITFARLHEKLTIPQMQQIRELIRLNANGNLADPFSGFSPAPATCSQVNLQKRFKELNETWKASKARNQLKNRLDFSIPPSTMKNVDKAICLGLGSLSNDQMSWNSMRQLVVFIDITELLSGGCVLIAQDPAFNRTDKEFLELLNVEVVESPTAFLNITNQTFVFAPHYSVSWWPAQLRTGCSPLVVGNTIEKTIDKTPHESELLQIFRRACGADSDIDIVDFHVKQELIQFNERYSSAVFPKLDVHEHAFTDTRLYWLQAEMKNFPRAIDTRTSPSALRTVYT